MENQAKAAMTKVRFVGGEPTWKKMWENVPYTDVSTEGNSLCGNSKFFAVSQFLKIYQN